MSKTQIGRLLWKVVSILAVVGLISCELSCAYILYPPPPQGSGEGRGKLKARAADHTDEPKTHVVQVGRGDHRFIPDSIDAAIGDTVQFEFYPVNHSVVWAEYNTPCVPIEMMDSNKLGFFSGFHVMEEVPGTPETFEILVVSAEPMFFYCSAEGSCMDYGMVGAINPNSTQTLHTFREAARRRSYQLSPGEPFPDEKASNPNSNVDTPPISDEDKTLTNPPNIKVTALSNTNIIIISVCTTLGIALIGLFFYFLGKRKGSTVARFPVLRGRWAGWSLGKRGGEDGQGLLHMTGPHGQTLPTTPMTPYFDQHNSHHHSDSLGSPFHPNDYNYNSRNSARTVGQGHRRGGSDLMMSPPGTSGGFFPESGSGDSSPEMGPAELQGGVMDPVELDGGGLGMGTEGKGGADK